MRVQQFGQSHSRRHKLAALLALFTPGLALADDAGNVLRQDTLLNAPIRNSDNEVRAVDHTDLVPLPDELTDPSGNAMKPLATDAKSMVVGDVDNWIPRAVRSRAVSPLLVPNGQGGQFQGGPFLSGPLVTWPLDQPSSNRLHIGDDLMNQAPIAGGVDSPIKLGQSASSTLKIIPNVLATEVNNPEQNEPAGATAPEEIVAAEVLPGEAIPAESADAMPLEAVADSGLIPQGDGEPLQPLPEEELLADEIATEDISESGAAGKQSAAAANSSADLSTSRAPIAVRKLRLGDDSQSGLDPVSLQPLDPSIARMRVGDVEPGSTNEIEAPRSKESVQPPAPSARLQPDNPIQGDTITNHGELILATGRHASNLVVKPHTLRLKPMIERTLKYYWDRPEDAAERTHWGMMHSIMVFDRDTQIVNRGQRFNAVAWMAGNNPCRNQTLFTQDQQGILPKTGVGLQGHQGQLLAIFGQINVPLNYPVYASKQKFTVGDILQRELRDCKVNTELTFTLIGLAHYTDSETTWISGDGQDWSLPRVIQEELAQPIVGAACGGTHRLMGFGHALRRRRAEGKPIDGQWERADRYVKDFVNYTWSLQNRDGSMSTSWYEKPEDNGQMDRKIQTTGHMLEMLMTVTPDADLQSPEMLRTVNFMASTLYTERGHEWQIGPKGHALRSLALYYQRVFGNATPWRPASGSRTAGASANRSVR
jgi:hypothetical protein